MSEPLNRFVFSLALVACAAPQSPRTNVQPTEPVVDASIDTVTIDASPIDAAIASVEDAAPELPKPVCWASQPNGVRTYALRVRVRASQHDESVPHDGNIYGVDWADLDIVEVLRGDMSRVNAPFRKSFYVSGSGGHCGPGGVHCATGRVSQNITELVDAKGEERIVVVTLPPLGSSGGAIPPKMRAKYGDLYADIFRVCPIVVGEGTEALPPIDDTCTTDNDCTTTGLFGTCCGNCEQRYSNKASVERVRIHCARHPPASCPPMGCSWGMAKPQCVAGHCGASTRR